MTLDRFEELVKLHLAAWACQMEDRIDGEPERYGAEGRRFEQSFSEWWACFMQSDPSDVVRNMREKL